MLTKILLTALVASIALAYTRQRNRTRQPVAMAGDRPPPRWYWRMLPAGLLLAVLGVAAAMFWLEWQERHRIFTVRVVDTRSGEVRLYAAYRDDVRGRSFKTIDGREVTLADVERMEITEAQIADTRDHH